MRPEPACTTATRPGCTSATERTFRPGTCSAQGWPSGSERDSKRHGTSIPPKPMVHGKHEAKTALVGGVVAGLVAGVFNDLMMIVGGLVKHEDFWGHIKFASYPFLGHRATLPGFDGAAVLAGVLCNFLVSVIWAVLFALLVYGLTRG